MIFLKSEISFKFQKKVHKKSHTASNNLQSSTEKHLKSARTKNQEQLTWLTTLSVQPINVSKVSGLLYSPIWISPTSSDAKSVWLIWGVWRRCRI